MASEWEAIPRRNSSLAAFIPLSSRKSEKKEAGIFPNEGLFLIPGFPINGCFQNEKEYSLNRRSPP